MKRILLLLLFFSLTTCAHKDFFQSADEFLPYVKAFIAEGTKRGKTINPKKGGLIIEFGILEKHQLGRSKPNNYPKIITINQEVWQNLDTFQRRALIFHELGHCLLQRKHRNQLLSNGACASLLAGKEDGFQCSQNLYAELWWNYYVDELFNPKVKLPSWYSNEWTNYHHSFQKDYLMNSVNPTFQLDTTLQIEHLERHYKNSVGKRGGWFFFEIDMTKDYQVEVSYEVEKEDYKSYRLSWKDVYFRVAPTQLSIGTSKAKFYEAALNQNHLIKKLTIRKIGDLYYFFFNEKMIHIIEVNYPKGKELRWMEQMDKSVLKTNFVYENEAALKIEVAYLN